MTGFASLCACCNSVTTQSVLPLRIRISRVDDQLECRTVAQPDRREMPDISCRETTDAKIVGERHDARIDEAEMEIGIAPVNLHGPRELIECWWSIGKRATRQIVNQRLHGWPFIAKEIVDFRQHEAGT
jgi:hypothetical protein